MAKYRVITDESSSNYYDVEADEYHWQHPDVSVRGKVPQATGGVLLLVFSRGGKPVAEFKVEHVIGLQLM